MTAFSVGQGVAMAVGRGLTQAGAGGGAFDPASLFSGQAGYAYDPKNTGTLWQDTAATIPAAASDPLGRINDISGNATHRTVVGGTAAKRPVTGLGIYTFDGVDDGMTSTASTAAGGAWTWVVRINAGADASFVSIFGSSGSAYLGVAVSGAGGATVDPAATTLTEITVNGTVVTNTQAALYTALTGGAKTLVYRASGLTNAQWVSIFRVGDYAGFTFSGSFGREILINRDLATDELADASEWVAA